jgi:hypothetical protein
LTILQARVDLDLVWKEEGGRLTVFGAVLGLGGDPARACAAVSPAMVTVAATSALLTVTLGRRHWIASTQALAKSERG